MVITNFNYSFEHHAYPGESGASDIACSRDNRSPVEVALFAFDNLPAGNEGLRGYQRRSLRVEFREYWVC